MSKEKLDQIGVNVSEKANLIWNVADLIVGPFKEHEYGLVILPMTIIKRFHDCLLDKQDVMLKAWEEAKTFAEIGNKDVVNTMMTTASGYNFYNRSGFNFTKLLAEEDKIEENFLSYLHGFSDNVQDIIAKFKFESEIIPRLKQIGALYEVIKEFNSEDGYLGPDKISAVDCGYIFEDLIRRFSESYGDNAGAHFTSRDIIYLMTDILLEGKDLSNTTEVSVYDMAMGTSQMLTCMEERIHEKNEKTHVICYGQEINEQTFAIAKADILIRNSTNGDKKKVQKLVDEAENLHWGDTLSNDQCKGKTFQYIISNPPFGIEWKREQKEVEAEFKKGALGRFEPGLPKISDSQQLFVLNGLSKLEENGKMAIIQNGSAMFTGDAASGSSEIRRYFLETHDWLETIIQLPNDSFMNTGISTYIWIFNKNKSKAREGKVQLIDASHCFEQRRKSIGNKRNDISDKCAKLIVKAYSGFKDNELYGNKDGIYCQSKIFDCNDFGYNKIVVERPLRYCVEVNDKAREIFSAVISTKAENKLDCEAAAKTLNNKKWNDYNVFIKDFEKALPEHEDNGKKKKMKLSSKEIAAIRAAFCSINKDAEKVILKQEKGITEYEPDTNLRDTENIPLKEDIQEYFKREVLPFAPDAWVDESATKIGYEIPMTRYFYKYKAPEKAVEIFARVTKLEEDISFSLKSLLGDN